MKGPKKTTAKPAHPTPNTASDTAPEPSARFIELGKAVKPHGLKGAIKTIIWSESDDNLRPGVKLRVVPEKGEPHTLTISRVAPLGELFQVYFEGITTVEAAERYRNATLLIPREEMSEGLYLEDLKGAQVRFDDSPEDIGTIKDFFINPAGQTYGILSGDRYVALFLDEVEFDGGVVTIPRKALIDASEADEANEAGEAEES